MSLNSDAVETFYKDEHRCQIIISGNESDVSKIPYRNALKNDARRSYELLQKRKLIQKQKQVDLIVDTLEREFDKNPERFTFVDSEYHFVNIKYIVYWIADFLEFEKIGIDVTPWGSIIFSVIVNPDYHVQLIYDYTVEDKEGELYFAYFLNKKEIKSALNRTDVILPKLTEFLPIDRNQYISSPQTAAFEESLPFN